MRNQIIPLHRGVAPKRDDNVVAFPNRFEGPPRHVRIGDGHLSGDLIALLLGASVALWCVLILLAIKLWPEIAAFVRGVTFWMGGVF